MIEIYPHDLQQALEWSLVLHSKSIPHALEYNGSSWALKVKADYGEKALEEIAEYEGENRGWNRGREVSYELKKVEGVVLSSTLVFATFSLALSVTYMDRLIDAGANQYSAVSHGEIWRVITSLTLHADPAHLVSNYAIGTLFIALYALMVGPPVAWATALFTGAMGNLLSILFFPRTGTSIGASTAVFGILGALCSFSAVRARIEGRKDKRPFVYLGAGLGLLSFLGVGDEHTDRTAHLTGFFTGIITGMTIGFRPRHWIQWTYELRYLIYCALIAIVLCAWMLAIHGITLSNSP